MAHDPSKYHPDFPIVSWRLKTERAMGQCEYIYPSGNRCQARDWEPHPATGSMAVLAACHLDHDPSHVDPARMRVFCQKHHNQHDADYRTRQRLARERAEALATAEAAGQLGFELGEG